MKRINIVLLAVVLTASLFVVIMCGGSSPSFVTGAFVEFTYPVPDGLITDPEEKEAMITAKIENLEATNEIYWGDLPGDNDSLTKGFQGIWGFIRTKYPAFKGILKTEDNPDGVDWDEVGENGYENVQYVENYGQFARILTRMGWVLKEGHTSISTKRMIGHTHQTPFRRIYPALTAGGYISKIGACVLVTEDEELVITELAGESNPYNFKPGDEIVGFNGVPWSEWLTRLIDSELPIYGSPASNEHAIRYNLLKGAMYNSNLFEKINIKRYGSDEVETMNIVYVPFKHTGYNPCAGYIGDVPGVERPKFSLFRGSEVATYGKTTIDGQKLGYMYITACPEGFDEFEDEYQWDPYETEWSKEFDKMIVELSEGTDGIIFDLRYNVGGRNETFYLGMSKLIDSDKDEDIFNMLVRNAQNTNMLALVPGATKEPPLKADPDTSYKKPVVVLTGPNCISACDFLMALFSKYPDQFRIIGKPHNGSFTGVRASNYDIGNGDVVHQYIPRQVGAYYTDQVPKDTNEVIDYDLLVRRSFTQEEVWQTKDSVANGEDLVRKRAVEIIKNGGWEK